MNKVNTIQKAIVIPDDVKRYPHEVAVALLGLAGLQIYLLGESSEKDAWPDTLLEDTKETLRDLLESLENHKAKL